MQTQSFNKTVTVFSFAMLVSFITMAQTVKPSVRIAWDHSSLTKLAGQGGYPRMLRVAGKEMWAIYENYSGSIHLKKSIEGSTWTSSQEVFSPFVYADDKGNATVVNMSNPEIIQLQNGHILIACNYRPRKQGIAPYAIVVRRSIDTGKTWLAPQMLYAAGTYFKDGCWEPSFLQLPDGEVQVYFANEGPYRESDEQEISVVQSQDNGLNWSGPKTVSFRKSKRDGMPVGIILKDEIILAIEDNYADRFKPYTVRTKISENWRKPVSGESDKRNYALSEKIADSVYMGAPYLLKLPNGQTLLSYQTNEHRSADWELSTMEVAIGDDYARNFSRRTRPFNLGIQQQAKWNALALWDEHTVVAVASANPDSQKIAPWYKKGYIIPDALQSKNPKKKMPVFVGSGTYTHARAGIFTQGIHTKVICRVTDTNQTDKNRGLSLFFYDGIEKFKIWCGADANSRMYVEKDRQWNLLLKKPEVEMEADTGGYTVICTLPEGRKNNHLAFGIALSFVGPDGNAEEAFLADMKEDDVSSWIRIL